MKQRVRGRFVYHVNSVGARQQIRSVVDVGTALRRKSARKILRYETVPMMCAPGSGARSKRHTRSRDLPYRLPVEATAILRCHGVLTSENPNILGFVCQRDTVDLIPQQVAGKHCRIRTAIAGIEMDKVVRHLFGAESSVVDLDG